MSSSSPLEEAASRHWGQLLKRGPTAKHGWKLRWVQVDSRCISYFRNDNERDPLGTIALADVVRVHADGNGVGNPREAPTDVGPLVFTVVVREGGAVKAKKKLGSRKTEGPGREFVFCALSEDSKRAWCQTLQANVARLQGGAPLSYPSLVTDGGSSSGSVAVEPLPAGDGLYVGAECVCVLAFVPQDYTTQLTADVGERFSVLMDAADGFLLLQRSDSEDRGLVPMECVVLL